MASKGKRALAATRADDKPSGKYIEVDDAILRDGRCGGQLLGPHRSHFDTSGRSFVFKDDSDGVDDASVWMFFAVDDYLVFGDLAFSVIEKMFVCQPIVPAAIPCGEKVGVLLIGVCELSARQFLNVDVSIGVDVGAELGLVR